MKVGILTFHFGRNYGALLQAYALRKAIELLGNEARVIHYIPQHCYGHMSLAESRFLRLGWRTYGPRLAIDRRFRTFRFNHFKRKALRLTPRCLSKDDLVHQVAQLDAIVVGSDQVWNLNYVQSNDLCYFLDFPIPESVRCISYAACCGRKDQPSTHLATLSEFFAKFHALGVRNEMTAQFVQLHAKRTPTIVADPTLLGSFAEDETGYTPNSKYILSYVLEQNSFADFEKVILQIKKQLGLPVLAIADANHIWQDFPQPGADRTLYGVSPGRFLKLIKHAACVVTDSFHGTIFSVKYQRPFITLNDAGWRNMRMNDLANRYGIGHRIKSIHNVIEPDMLCRSDDLLDILRSFDAHKVASYDYLQRALVGSH
jgi:hypothetical protein